MSTHSQDRLREAPPKSPITLLTHEKLADLFEFHPHVDEIMRFRAGEGVFSIANRLRSKAFDLAILFPNSPRSALEVFLARIPRRLGYRRGGRGLLLTDPVPPRPQAVRMHKRSVKEIRSLIAIDGRGRGKFSSEVHHVHDYLHLLTALGIEAQPSPPRLYVQDDAVAQAKKQLPNHGVWLGLNPGAE